MDGAFDAIYEFDENKRMEILAAHKLDIAVMAPLIMADPNVIITRDTRHDYREERFRAFGIVDKEPYCLCFTPRNGKIRLITIFRISGKKMEGLL